MTTPVRILFVEDNEYLRETIAELMEAPGRTIVPCADAEAALAALQQQPVDVLFTDVSLPVLSGADLARAALARTPDLWVVFCSGYPFPADLSALGPNVRSLGKPFELDDLDALLAEITVSLDRKRLAA